MDDLAATVDRLRGMACSFRNDIVLGNGGKQILLDDPPGNPIQLFESAHETGRLMGPGPRSGTHMDI